MSNEDEMTYNFLCSKLEKDGWIKETTFINEKMAYTTSLSSVNPGETTLIADIMCPTDTKILIRGTENGDIEKFRDAYSIKLSLSDNLGKEVSQITKIRITKDKMTEGPIREGISSPTIRCFYTDISKGDKDHIYRPRKNILLQGEEHLFIYVIGENIGEKLPDITIDKNHISFNIKADIFTFDREKNLMDSYD